MMSPGQIAVLCWEQKDEQSPEETILEALGLDKAPAVSTHGEAVTWRYYDCVKAWTTLVGERATNYRDALPQKHRLEKGRRIIKACEFCGAEMELLPFEARKGRRFCNNQCAYAGLAAEREDAPTEVDPERVERNERILAALEKRQTKEVADQFGLTPSMVRLIRRNHEKQEGR